MEKVSNCCGASPIDLFDEVEVCPKCKEHCEFEYICQECDNATTTPVIHEKDAHHYIPMKVQPDVFCSEECRDNHLEKNYDRWVSDNI